MPMTDWEDTQINLKVATEFFNMIGEERDGEIGKLGSILVNISIDLPLVNSSARFHQNTSFNRAFAETVTANFDQLAALALARLAEAERSAALAFRAEAADLLTKIDAYPTEAAEVTPLAPIKEV
jgi:hypothetical protein